MSFFNWITFTAVNQVLFAVGLLACGLFVCFKKKKAKPKHKPHGINLSQPKTVSKKPKPTHKALSKSANKAPHSRSKTKSIDQKEKKRHHKNERIEEPPEEEKQKNRMSEVEKEKVPEESFPEVPEPTKTAKRKREKEIEREKLRRIKEGFYQERSDEDDTLEPIRSLKEEYTDK